jgi:hypothetical protein
MDFPLLLAAKDIIIQVLEKHDLKPIGSSTQDVLQSYFNFKHKIIHQRPREVLKSASISAKAEDLGVSEILKNIEQRFINGEDINPNLSKKIFHINEHDSLLNDWAIHHLHLSDIKVNNNDYFNKRSDFLLFCHVTPDEVYFIDIRPHNESYVFAQRDLIRAIRDNWPELNKKIQVGQEPMEIYPRLEDKDIAILRKKGYMTFTQVDSFVYMPGQGSTTSGFSLEAGREMDEFHRALYKIHSYTQEFNEQLKEEILDKDGKKLEHLQFSLAYKDWMFYVFELNSKRFVDFDLLSYQTKYPNA